MPKKKSKSTKKLRSTKRSQPPASEIPTINDKELELLRIFKAVDALPNEGQFGHDRYLYANKTMIDGKALPEIFPQIKELAQREAFRDPGAPFQVGPHASPRLGVYYIIHMIATNTDHYRKLVSEAISAGLIKD